jgi:hypothetical protein
VIVVFGGRKQDEEDPFAALKDGGRYSGRPVRQPTGIPGTGIEPTEVPPPRPLPGRRPATPVRPRTDATAARRRGVLLLVAMVCGVVAAALVGALAGHISKPITAVHVGPGAGGSSFPTAPVRPTHYLTAAGLAQGLAQVERTVPGVQGVSLLRIDATSLSVNAKVSGAVYKNVVFGPYGTFVTANASTGQRYIRIASIEPQAVPRLQAAMQRQYGVAPREIDYMVLDWIPGLVPQWVLYTRAQKGYVASMSGENPQPIP